MASLSTVRKPTMVDLAEPDIAAGPSSQTSATSAATGVSNLATIELAARTEMEVARLEELDLKRSATTAMRQATSCETTDDRCGLIASSHADRHDIKESGSSSVGNVAEGSSMEGLDSKEDSSSRMPCRVPIVSDLATLMTPAL